MKKLISITSIAFALFLLSNCSPKTGKETASSGSATTNNAPAANIDVVKMAQGDRSNEDQVAYLLAMSDQRRIEGKALYETSCKKCHKLHAPESLNAVSWVKIMKSMGPKAHLQQDAYSMISSYLVKNAKQ